MPGPTADQLADFAARLRQAEATLSALGTDVAGKIADVRYEASTNLNVAREAFLSEKLARDHEQAELLKGFGDKITGQEWRLNEKLTKGFVTFRETLDADAVEQPLAEPPGPSLTAVVGLLIAALLVLWAILLTAYEMRVDPNFWRAFLWLYRP